MRRPVLALALGLASLGATGCGDPPSATGDVKQSDVEERACTMNQQTLQALADAQLATTGQPAATLADLGQDAAELVDSFELVDGQVVAKPDGPCA